ncbi:MAG: exopolyphosphatase [Selenomonadaceae bacterium]|nr:exopolyphosphatase [Selenomonadaceae bacterium]
MLHGIIDIGSSTVRMAIYDIHGGDIDMLLKKKHVVGLAAYVKDGVMTQQGIDKAVEILEEFVSFLRCFRITRVAAFTTAALRNAKNSREAVSEIERRTGLAIRVISGDEEATFDFIGATHAFSHEDGVLVDIGGGSTELVAFSGGAIQQKVSLPLGATDFHARFSDDVLPTLAECRRMEEEAARILAGADSYVSDVSMVSFNDLRTPELAGIGGTFKSGLALYNAVYGKPLENLVIDATKLPELIRRFTSDRDLAQDDVVLLMRAVPDRLPTILPGLTIAHVVCQHFGARTITYSDSGVREGYIYSEIIGK